MIALGLARLDREQALGVAHRRVGRIALGQSRERGLGVALPRAGLVDAAEIGAQHLDQIRHRAGRERVVAERSAR
ncbi:MAG: hypothetical protein U0168_26195 [Nannocystaceae bacterium]